MKNSYHKEVPGHEEFMKTRMRDIESLTAIPRSASVRLLSNLISKRFEYVWTWRGVPIIRLPEDLLIQQELISNFNFKQIVEVGVARGGGILFSADMQRINDIEINVIGVDNIVHAHTNTAVKDLVESGAVKIIRGDSTCEAVLQQVSSELAPQEPTLVVLDSDHSKSHVLKELTAYSGLLSEGSVIIVCDTLIDELGEGFFPERPWDDGKGPLAAVNDFLLSATEWTREDNYGKRGILTEIRDGVLFKKGTRRS